MSSDGEYRRQAAYAKKQARLAKNDTERESWLWIAQGWISLSRKRPQSDEEVFNQQRQDKRTGHDIDADALSDTRAP